MQYVQRVSRIRHLAREYWFELLIAVLAIAGMLELVVGRDSPGAPTTTLWFAVPAIAVLVLPLFARRRFPFAAPAAYWLLAAALSFVDGLLIPFIGSLGVVGLAAAFLLGNLRDGMQARHRPRASCSAACVDRRRQHPRRTDGQRAHLHPAPVRGRLARGLRPARARRAGRGGRGARDPGRARARGSRADRRGRGARADRARAPRHRRPRRERDGAPGRRRPAQAPRRARRRTGMRSAGVEQAGRTALAEMRRLLGAMRRDGDGPRARAAAGPRRPRLAARRGRPRRAPRRAARRRRAVPASARRSTSPPTGSSRRA